MYTYIQYVSEQLYSLTVYKRCHDNVRPLHVYSFPCLAYYILFSIILKRSVRSEHWKGPSGDIATDLWSCCLRAFQHNPSALPPPSFSLTEHEKETFRFESLSPESNPVWRFLWYSSWRMREKYLETALSCFLLATITSPIIEHKQRISREVTFVSCSVVK